MVNDGQTDGRMDGRIVTVIAFCGLLNWVAQGRTRGSTLIHAVHEVPEDLTLQTLHEREKGNPEKVPRWEETIDQ